jgi:hypothetical protein
MSKIFYNVLPKSISISKSQLQHNKSTHKFNASILKHTLLLKKKDGLATKKQAIV